MMDCDVTGGILQLCGPNALFYALFCASPNQSTFITALLHALWSVLALIWKPLLLSSFPSPLHCYHFLYVVLRWLHVHRLHSLLVLHLLRKIYFFWKLFLIFSLHLWNCCRFEVSIFCAQCLSTLCFSFLVSPALHCVAFLSTSSDS